MFRLGPPRKYVSVHAWHPISPRIIGYVEADSIDKIRLMPGRKYYMNRQSDFDSVGDFHRKFNLATSDTIELHLMDPDTFLYRYDFLLEELHELLKAYRARDIAGVADALADLVYVALGTAHLSGIPFDEVFAEVQRANMTKERAKGAGDGRSKRGHSLDVVKPEGWKAPDIAGVLAEHVRTRREAQLAAQPAGPGGIGPEVEAWPNGQSLS